MMMNNILDKLDIMIPNPRCELNYNKDYELLIATVLSAQTKDLIVNMVTKELWNKYDIYTLSEADINDVIDIIKPLGSFTKKSKYIIDIAKHLVEDYNGIVPNNRAYLESLNGVGRKTCNVVLNNLFNVPSIAVDTHVERVSKRLSLARRNDSVETVEKKLMKKLPKDKWGRLHHQLVLFGRYICKAKNPSCSECLLKDVCKYYEKNRN